MEKTTRNIVQQVQSFFKNDILPNNLLINQEGVFPTKWIDIGNYLEKKLDRNNISGMASPMAWAEVPMSKKEAMELAHLFKELSRNILDK